MLLKDLVEGIYDPHNFKALFVVGIPGSGKSTIIKKLTASSGLTVVDPDKFFSQIMAKKGHSTIEKDWDEPESLEKSDPTQPTKLTEPPPEWSAAQKSFRYLTNLLTQNRRGIVIDTAGRYFPFIQEIMNQLTALGYECAMLFVDVDIDVAIARQALRSRKVGDNKIREYHQLVSNNVPKFKEQFGDNFVMFDNNESRPAIDDPAKLKYSATKIKNLYHWFHKWANARVTNRAAQEWYDQQKKKQKVAQNV